MARTHKLGLSQVLAVVIVVLVIISGFTGYLIGVTQPAKPGTGINSSLTNNSTSTSASAVTTNTVIQLKTSTTWTTQSTTVYATSYAMTLTAEENNSLSNIVLANITTGNFPQSLAVDPKTDRVYVTYWNGTTYLAVIDGSTNRLIDTISNVSSLGDAPLLVDPQTNLIFISNEIINGSTDQVVAHIDSNLTFVALDVKDNLAYATQMLPGPNRSTIVFKINPFTDGVVGSQVYSGQLLEDFVFDENSSILYTTDCTGFFECYPSYVLGINGSSLALDSNVSAGFVFFNMAWNPQSNMIYITSLQNLLIVINGTNGQLITQIPITAYANELFGIAVDPSANEFFLAGNPNCSGLVECGDIVLYVLSSFNYGFFATFAGGNSEGPVILQFDPANNETYMAFESSSYLLALRIPQYNLSVLLS